jgi:acyl transferase domain-containing protein
MQLAVDAIRKGRCPRAVVGGVNLTLTAKSLGLSWQHLFFSIGT